MCVKVWLIYIKAVPLHRLMEYALAGLCENPARKRLKGLVSRTISSSTRCRGEVASKLAFEAGGEIDKNTKQNKSINYEKNFTFNFCCDAGGVQRAGAELCEGDISSC